MDGDCVNAAPEVERGHVTASSMTSRDHFRSANEVPWCRSRLVLRGDVSSVSLPPALIGDEHGLDVFTDRAAVVDERVSSEDGRQAAVKWRDQPPWAVAASRSDPRAVSDNSPSWTKDGGTHQVATPQFNHSRQCCPTAVFSDITKILHGHFLRYDRSAFLCLQPSG